MKNISINSESLELSIDKSYNIIDALYLNDIKKELSNTKLKTFVAGYFIQILFRFLSLDNLKLKILPHKIYLFL